MAVGYLPFVSLALYIVKGGTGIMLTDIVVLELISVLLFTLIIMITRTEL